jgi:hypothetical protein
MTDEQEQVYRDWASSSRDENTRTPCPGCGVDFNAEQHFYKHDQDCPLMAWVGEQAFPALKPPPGDFYHQTVDATGLDPRHELYRPTERNTA